MKQNSILFIIIGFLMCLVFLPVSSAAQEQGGEDGERAINRVLRSERQQFELPAASRRPLDFLNTGLYYKGFNYLASLGLGGFFNSNIFADSEGEESDYAAVIQPNVTVRKFFGPHIFLLGTSANIERFASQTDEDKEEYNIFTRALLEGNSNWQFPLSAGVSRNYRDRSSQADSETSVVPTRIDRFEFNAGVNRRFNRFSLLLLGSYTDVEFEDSFAIDGSGPVVFSDNDRRSVRVALKPRYEFPRGDDGTEVEHVIFGDLSVGKQIFDRDNFTGTGFDGLNSDRTDFNALVGFETSYKGFLFANLSAGILRQDFDEDIMDSVNEFDFEATVDYNITPKLTLGFTAGREIDQDNDFLVGIVRTDYELSADYELRHDWYLSSDVGYTTFEFEDIVGREDEDIEFGFGVNYIGSQHFEGNLKFRYIDRSSDVPEEEFDRFIATVGITSRL